MDLGFRSSGLVSMWVGLDWSPWISIYEFCRVGGWKMDSNACFLKDEMLYRAVEMKMVQRRECVEGWFDPVYILSLCAVTQELEEKRRKNFLPHASLESDRETSNPD